MATQLQIRRDTAADLTLATPVEAEPGYDQTNKRMIVGDGSRAEGIPHVSFLDAQSQPFVFDVAAGTADAITLDFTDGTLDYNPTAYVTGQRFVFKASADNTGSVTVNVNSLGAKTVKKNAGADNLVAGDILNGGIYTITYDGANFQLGSGAGGGAASICWVQDQVASGTGGGTFTSGAWRTRNLNTENVKTISGASLSSNQITLPAGTYEVFASAGAFRVGLHQTRIYDATNTIVLALGTTAFTESSTGDYSPSTIRGRFTLAGSAAIELQHRCTTTKADNGLGVDAALGNNNVFADILIRKVS